MPQQGPKTGTHITPPSAARAFDILRFDGLDIDRAQIERLLGLKIDRGAHQRWFEQLDRMLVDLRRLLRPRGVFRIDEVVDLQPGRLRLASGAEYAGTVGALLRHSRLVASWIVTIGSGLERLSRGWLQAGKVMPGTIADAIASEAAEATAQQLQDAVRAWARSKGLDITPRFSPGYCGLHLREQRTLFASLPASRINVRLTPSYLMLPIKSISGLIGIGPPDKVSPVGCPCELCNHPDCAQRRAPFDRNRGTCQDWGTVGGPCPVE